MNDKERLAQSLQRWLPLILAGRLPLDVAEGISQAVHSCAEGYIVLEIHDHVIAAMSVGATKENAKS